MAQLLVATCSGSWWNGWKVDLCLPSYVVRLLCVFFLGKQKGLETTFWCLAFAFCRILNVDLFLTHLEQSISRDHKSQKVQRKQTKTRN